MDRETVVLWDIDKTITAPSSLPDLFGEVLDDLLGHPHRGKLPSKDGKTDSQIAREYLAAAGLGEELLPLFMRRLEDVSEDLFKRASLELVPGVYEALATLRKQAVTNGLYTGNTPARAQLKLRAAGLDPDLLFDTSASYCLGYEPDRFAGLRAVRRDHPGSQLVVVGDAPSDLEVARRLDVPFWHVLSGGPLAYTRMMGESEDFAGSVLASFVAAVVQA